MQIELINFLKADQILRFFCSDLGAICGYNPWCDFDELFEKYLYQDLEELLQLDAKNLGQEIVSVEQEVENILQRIDAKEVRDKFFALNKDVKDATVLNNNSKANEMLMQIRNLVKDEKLQSQISKTEMQQIEKEYSGKVRKNYGVNCEGSNLDRYEEYSGFKVVDRNVKCITMKVMPLPTTSSGSNADCDDVTSDNELMNGSNHRSTQQEEDQTAMFSGSSCNNSSSNNTGDSEVPEVVVPQVSNAFTKMMAAARTQQQEQQQKDNNKSKDSVNYKRSSQSVAAASAKRKRAHVRPSFLIIGRVDGVSYQIDTRDNDAHKWFPIKVVVEMKTRVRRISNPPPIYEQIQLVSYMLMLNCQCGDLVQSIALRKNQKRSIPKEIVDLTAVGTTEETEDSIEAATVETTLESAATVETTDKKAVATKTAITAAATAVEASDGCGDFSIRTICSYKNSSISTLRSDTEASIINSAEAIQATQSSASESVSIETKSDDNERRITVKDNSKISISSVVATTALSPKVDNNDSFHVTRIYLQGAPYYHKHHWDTVVLPRLHCFRDAVISMRMDDSLRYQYLVAATQEKKLILSRLCPYLELPAS